VSVLAVNGWSGSIVYNTIPDNIKYPWPRTLSGGGGGVSGGGSIWSSTEQVIWIKYDGAPAYPVYLKPGYNDVRFWIPTIFPENTWVEAKLEIIATGYILIPAGFEWEVITGENVPPAPPNSKRIDKIKFIDLYDVVINYVPVPVDDQNVIDNVTFKDVYDTNIRTIDTDTADNIDGITFKDISDIDLITPIPP
jgi:hypothetical protein